jgi:hypothetical protein
MLESRSEISAQKHDDPACPPQAELKSFVAGRLDSMATRPLFAHLQTCPICGKNLGNYCRFFSLKEAQLESSELS